MFFSFLRLSNILSHTLKTFDSTRQLARGDFISVDHGAVVLIKEAKLCKIGSRHLQSLFPILGASHFCPITAISKMIQLFPASPNDHLFVIPHISKDREGQYIGPSLLFNV